nr:hypothetical protein [Candidatus Sigynarchaeota archaeon]
PEPVASDVLSKRDTDNERAGAGLLVSYAGGPIGTSRLAPASHFFLRLPHVADHVSSGSLLGRLAWRQQKKACHGTAGASQLGFFPLCILSA